MSAFATLRTLCCQRHTTGCAIATPRDPALFWVLEKRKRIA
ncbi:MULTISPECIES: hypothetical protein [Xanthomonas]|uniref:Uncharacterized protein n=1 Tax=Xanthomonas euvesicatoria TaxID=456327 RepID=A0AAX4FHQ7_XANEU|nr:MULTISPECIES: hypothetical protein [Xanthomonas]MDC9648671.1 hypothetical protein [Xanthomonas euvesicatoria]MDC9653148.1 hypothetical protein [Xanthomonas perforans]MDC9660321.1 hypothetical protein [Xanthomonas euvesicatoria]MDC9668021.1 hypothetical protein [Xanthomonas euvesicatoria]MDC9674042.1 hypothetical protein [Xanthomonas perforans]